MLERQANSNIVMGKKRHFFGKKDNHSDKPVVQKDKEKHTEKKNHKTTSHDGKPNQIHKALKTISKKEKDKVIKAMKIQKIKADAPWKTSESDVKAQYKPEVIGLKPEAAVDEKPVPKDEEDDSDESGEVSKAVVNKSDETDADDDDTADDNNDSDEVGWTELFSQ